MLRFTWVLVMFPNLFPIARQEYRYFVITIIEEIRRVIWAYFRLETEHIHNR